MTTIELFTYDEVAEMLRIKKTTLYTYVMSGRIGCYRTGKKTLFAQKHLDEFLDSIETPVKGTKKGTDAVVTGRRSPAKKVG